MKFNTNVTDKLLPTSDSHGQSFSEYEQMTTCIKQRRFVPPHSGEAPGRKVIFSDYERMLTLSKGEHFVRESKDEHTHERGIFSSYEKMLNEIKK